MMFLLLILLGIAILRGHLIAAIPYFGFLFVSGIVFAFVPGASELRWLIIPIGEELVKLTIVQRMNLNGVRNYVFVSATVGYLDAVLRVGETEFSQDFQNSGSPTEMYLFLLLMFIWIIFGHSAIGLTYLERLRRSVYFCILPIICHIGWNYTWSLITK